MDMSSKKCVTQQGDEKGFGGGKKIKKNTNYSPSSKVYRKKNRPLQL